VNGRANTLAYYNAVTITAAVKSFTLQALIIGYFSHFFVTGDQGDQKIG
jgi:hypothetical protein